MPTNEKGLDKWWILQEYEAIYKANVAHAAFPPPHRMAPRRKRSEEDDEDEERLAFSFLL